MNMKKCLKCEIEKPVSSFSQRLKSTDQLQRLCKSCDYERLMHWKKNNLNHIREYRKNYKKERRDNDEIFRLADNLRSRLRHAMLRQVAKKNDKTENLLGISYSEFKDYIEFLMTSGMTWKNIELDHIQPLSSFDLTDSEQLKEATHFTNIQPLLKKETSLKVQDFMSMI